eukprot:TRINITY_DN20771_c0_g1_i1.p1 TRINITY_DN20771_c0_g1~~TRINITY_DN20771_c0_g1_i1.p1  ORF type:complete len:499 (+),score=48.52 TRINITY_DN20771_c0_g1_i1:57-1499(+)
MAHAFDRYPDDDVIQLDDDVALDDDAVPQVHRGRSDLPPQSSVLGVFANAFISFIGAGILDLPYAFSRVGWLLGTVMLAGIAVVNLYCMLLVIIMYDTLTDAGKSVKTYGDVGWYAMGRCGSLLADVFIAVSQVGFCIAYIVFINTNLLLVFRCSDVPAPVQMVVFTFGFGILSGLCLVRHLKWLAPSSIFADICYAVGITLILSFDFQNILQHTHHDLHAVGRDDATATFKTEGIPFFFGVVIYCFEGITLVIPIYSTFQRRFAFRVIWSVNTVIVTTLFILFGAIGYSAYGSATLDIVTLNMPSDVPATTLVRLVFCLGLFCTYPVMMFPVFSTIEGPLFAVLGRLSGGGPTSFLELKRSVFRVAVVLMTFMVAVSVPNFGLFVSLVGSTACATLAFILPPLYHLRICRPRGLVAAIDVTVLLLGLIGLAFGLAQSLSDVMAGGRVHEEPSCEGQLITNTPTPPPTLLGPFDSQFDVQ